MSLFKMEKVNLLSEESFESQPETWRLFVSEKLGSVRIIDGFCRARRIVSIHQKMGLLGHGLEYMIGLEVSIALLWQNFRG